MVIWCCCLRCIVLMNVPLLIDMYAVIQWYYFWKWRLFPITEEYYQVKHVTQKIGLLTMNQHRIHVSIWLVHVTVQCVVAGERKTVNSPCSVMFWQIAVKCTRVQSTYLPSILPRVHTDAKQTF